MKSGKIAKVQKSNEMNQANFSDFSLSCYRVLLNLISQIQRHDSSGNQMSLPIVSRMCSLSANEYIEEFPSSAHRAYEILKEATDKLLNTMFTTKSVRGNVLKINVCSQAEYIDSEGRIDIRFTEEIMPHLAELGEKFTMYNLNEIAGFGSIYTTRLYELLMQFKITGELKIKVNELRFKLGCTDILKQYCHFKVRAINHAVDEINSQWTLDVKYEEIKKSRTVTDLIFTFKPTFTRKAYDPVKKKMRTEFTRPRRKTVKEIEIELKEEQQQIVKITKNDTVENVQSVDEIQKSTFKEKVKQTSTNLGRKASKKYMELRSESILGTLTPEHIKENDKKKLANQDYSNPIGSEHFKTVLKDLTESSKPVEDFLNASSVNIRQLAARLIRKNPEINLSVAVAAATYRYSSEGRDLDETTAVDLFLLTEGLK